MQNCVVSISSFCGGRIMLIFFAHFIHFKSVPSFNLQHKIKGLFCLHLVDIAFLSYGDHVTNVFFFLEFFTILTCTSTKKLRSGFDLMVRYPVSIHTPLICMYSHNLYIFFFFLPKRFFVTSSTTFCKIPSLLIFLECTWKYLTDSTNCLTRK